MAGVGAAARPPGRRHRPVTRLAVIGGGPKALFALLALHDRLPGPVPLTVEVYDPQPPGAGSVWRVAQPGVLRLNVRASLVDASSSLSTESFVAWLARTRPALAADGFPPRAVVGAYLRAQYELLAQAAHFTLRHVPSSVTSLRRRDGRWQLNGAGAAYDAVLLSTGHGLATAATRAPAGMVNAHPLIGDYAALTKDRLPAGSTVWVRGAALTGYDVALLLTEGRGGTWCEDGPAGLRYLPSGREPHTITLASRTGRLMHPKAPPVSPAVAEVLADYAARIRDWGHRQRQPPARPATGRANRHGLWVLLLACAQECAARSGSEVGALSLWRTALTGVSVPLAPQPTGAVTAEPTAAAEELRTSLAVNAGRAPLTTGWLWARVWAGLYPELVTALDRLPRTPHDQAHFLRVAGAVERFAFGPPEQTARKLLALLDAGRLTVVAGATTPPSGAVAVDAVTPGPGVLRQPAPTGQPQSALLTELFGQGLVTVRPGDRGLLTDLDATCLGADGSRTESLAALGRPTEDPILGHDTLNRALHHDHARWADALAAALLPLALGRS